LVTDFWGADNAVVCAQKQKCLLRDLKRTQHDHSPGADWPVFAKQLKRLIRDSLRLSKRRSESRVARGLAHRGSVLHHVGGRWRAVAFPSG
jgi:hypothetical protein